MCLHFSSPFFKVIYALYLYIPGQFDLIVGSFSVKTILENQESVSSFTSILQSYPRGLARRRNLAFV